MEPPRALALDPQPGAPVESAQPFEGRPWKPWLHPHSRPRLHLGYGPFDSRRLFRAKMATDPLIAVVCSDPTIAWDGRRRSRNSKGDMPETTKTERNSGALPRRPHGFLYQSPHALRAKPKGPRRWPADVGYIREIISRLDRVLRRVLASRKWLTTHLGTTYPT